MDIKNKVVLLTGGRRIGASVAENLAAQGAMIAFTYRNELGEMNELISKVEAHGRKCAPGRERHCKAFKADVSDEEAVEKLVEDTAKTFGRIDVLINMASIFKKRPFGTLSGKDWDEELGANAKSAFLMSQAVWPHMRAQGQGRIINFADWITASGRPNYTREGYDLYYVGKGAVEKFTQSLALRLAQDNITVNAIAPGPILRPPDLTEAENEEVTKQTPLGRWGGAEEIAKAVNFLIQSDFVTGEVIRVDGGRHLL